MRSSTSPSNPSKVLTTTFQMAMSSTLALAKDRATGKARPLYYGEGNRIKGMAKIWRDAKAEYQKTLKAGTPDAWELLKVEKDIRRSFTRVMLKTSVKYGNRETKREKRRKENQKYLNQLWDYAGGRLRDVMKDRFRFQSAGKIILGNGKIGVGYPGSSKIPIYPLRHNHLPELDFGDMIRSHLMELVRQCLKYGVPHKEAKKYVDELIDRLLPYLEYVYTERKTGTPNFIHGGIRELGKVVSRIRTQYGMRNGRAQSITSAISEASKLEMIQETLGHSVKSCVTEEGIESEVEQDVPRLYIDTTEIEDILIEEEQHKGILTRLIAQSEKEGIQYDDFIQQLRNKIDLGLITDEDAVQWLKDAIEESRRIGVSFHDFVARAFPSPFKLSAAVYHGDEMAYDKSGFMLVSELTVAGGRGRVDLVLMRRKFLSQVDESTPEVVYEPCMIVDLKTRSSFYIDIYGIESRSESENHIVNEGVLERKKLTKNNWDRVVSCPISESNRVQLDEYGDAILAEYRRTMWRDIHPPSDLVKAIIVVDSKEDWGKMGDAILPVVLEAYNRVSANNISTEKVIIPHGENDNPLRMVLKMASGVATSAEVKKIENIPSYSPFIRRIEDNKEFILYVSVAGRGTSSQSAAVLAARWHGLQYIHSLAHRKHRDVIWIDLTGEYRNPALARHRLRLYHQDASVKRFFTRRVQMRDLSSLIKSYLFKGSTLNELITEIDTTLKHSRRPLVVVTGWSQLRRGTSASLTGALNELVISLISEIPMGSTVVWFTEPVPLAQNNMLYETRCVAPFYGNTHWERYVDKVVWNLPLPPYRTGAKVPVDDHIRVLVKESYDDYQEPELIHVDILEGWGKSFRTGIRSLEDRIYSKGPAMSTVWSARPHDDDVKKAMTLIPYLGTAKLPTLKLSSDTYNLETLPVDESTDDPGMDERVIFRLLQYMDRIESDGRVKRLLPLEEIDQKRNYRPMTLGVEQPNRSTAPPAEALLLASPVNDWSIGWSELRALNRTLSFLERTQSNSVEWTQLIADISGVLAPGDIGFLNQSSSELMNRLRLVRQTLEHSDLTRSLWKRLWSLRAKIPKLDAVQRKHVETLLQKHPDLLHITGNHLFLMILAALGPGHVTAHTKSVELLWEYITPWHLTGIGLRPVYPESHTTGKSVLDRQKLLVHLRKKAKQTNSLLDKRSSVSNVRFGQLIVPITSGSASSVMLWLMFQREPGGQDLNVAFLTPSGLDPFLPPPDLLKSLVSGKTYWSESDVSRISFYAEVAREEAGIPIMIATHRGIQVLWIIDHQKGRWSPIGRIDYTTRRIEDVTLVRTIILREEPLLETIPLEDVRRYPSSLNDPIDVALYVVSKGLEGCKSVSCHVSLDHETIRYVVTFTDSKGHSVKKGAEFLRWLTERTDKLLAFLRKPDYECTPVELNNERFVWNRFRDIEYSSDVQVIRPWVERVQPLGHAQFALPLTAKDLLTAERGDDIVIEPYHDPWTCPLRYITVEDIRRERIRASQQASEYFSRFKTPLGQPERLSNEAGLSHGSCWGVVLHSMHQLPNEVMELNNIRFTDSALASLLESEELVYWSDRRGCWITHLFNLRYGKDFQTESLESWHLKALLHPDRKPIVPGSYLESENNWAPYFTIESERVTIGLELKEIEKRERHIDRVGLGLENPDDIRKFLQREMDSLLEQYSMSPNRKLKAAILNEIEIALEVAGASEDGVPLSLFSVEVKTDSVGGERLHIELEREDGERYSVPVTRHLHDLKEQGPFPFKIIEDEIRSKLSDYVMTKEDVQRAVDECYLILQDRRVVARR